MVHRSFLNPEVPMTFLIGLLSGCYQFHLPITDYPSESEKPVVVEASFTPGEFGPSANGLFDFGVMTFKIITEEDITVAISGLTLLVKRRDHNGSGEFVPSHTRDFFDECGLYEYGSVTPAFVGALGTDEIGFHGRIEGLTNSYSTSLRIMCSLAQGEPGKEADLAFDLPLESKILLSAVRDDGTVLERQSSIEYRPVIPNLPNVGWAVHFPPVPPTY